MSSSTSMRSILALASIMIGLVSISAFTLHPISPSISPSTSTSTSSKFNTFSSTSLKMGTNRRSRRNTRKQTQQSRPKSFYDAIEETQEEGDTATKTKGGNKNKKNKKGTEPPPPPQEDENSIVGTSSISDAQSLMNARPEVSTIIVDEETGIERIQQGQKVMDVVTRKAVQFSNLGPMYRLAQMFPGVPPDVREKHRVDWNAASVEELVEKYRDAASVEVKDEGTGGTERVIPPHPQVTNEAIDFVIANRDYLGPRMKKTLGRMKLRAQSQLRKEDAVEYRKLWKNFLTVEDSTSAPFRQMIMDAEGKVGPNFGNLDLKSYCNGELYERTACYIVLKGMVAHWEKKVRDAEYAENTPKDRSNFLDVLMVGDPKRYLPDPPIIYSYNECVRITLMAQNMTNQFCSTPELYDDLPPEVRFAEAASAIKGGTALRRYMIEDFCPSEGITPEALREGVRRFDVQLSNMQIDPYGDLKNVVGRLCDAMAVGTDDARDPYTEYLVNLDRNGPGYFQTYTFDHDRQSMVRFLDNAKEIQQGTIGPTDSVLDQLSNEATNLFGLGGPKKEVEQKVQEPTTEYNTPDERACGRPHNQGWLGLLGDEEMTGGSDDVEEKTFESDNWREVIQKNQGPR